MDTNQNISENAEAVLAEGSPVVLPSSAIAEVDRRASTDRRSGDRRKANLPFNGPDRRVALDRRRGPGRRRSDDRRSAEEGEMTPDQFEFLQAINEYKLVNRRPFPTWTEVLDIVKALGYRKVAQPSDIR